MAFIKWIFFGFCLTYQWKTSLGEVSWTYCEKQRNDFQLVNLTLQPDPLLAPGNASVAIKIYTNQNLTNPLKATLSLKKKLFFGHIPVPCFAIGTCIYDDLCAICTHCHCPMEPGEHTLNLPMRIESDSWLVGGIYQAEIHLEASSNQKGCIKLKNILIETKS